MSSAVMASSNDFGADRGVHPDPRLAGQLAPESFDGVRVNRTDGVLLPLVIDRTMRNVRGGLEPSVLESRFAAATEIAVRERRRAS